ncbi:MAG: SDR family NAD(P)-dependent oxidoreductase [Kiritimatiellia bacterium]
MMNENDLMECAVAVRMTCCNPEIIGKPAPAPFAVFSSTDAAKSLSESAERLERSGAEGPAVFLPGDVVPQKAAEIVAARIADDGRAPSIVAIEKTGLFATGPTAAMCTRTLSALEGGEAAAPEPGTGGRMAGASVLITGGARGFGRGLAEELASEGACVAVADINDEEGGKTARAINRAYGGGTAIYRRADVTSAESMDSCVRSAVMAFGGLDMLISNAGILKAGGLDEIEEKDFDMVTAVNYKGYFICARSAAAVMKLQHRYNPDYYMDIIQVNSKSGLEGSKRNFAYAGGKFGGIGLTQSFALELLESRIKVNAVCPGNYLDGPLWSDPDKGLFVQYLKAGKVKGAETVEDVRRHYVSKVPMGRGCNPSDVAKAVYYLREQEYETGQALPVTGGQVMMG